MRPQAERRPGDAAWLIAKFLILQYPATAAAATGLPKTLGLFRKRSINVFLILRSHALAAAPADGGIGRLLQRETPSP